jgi:hypothetical protein
MTQNIIRLNKENESLIISPQIHQKVIENGMDKRYGKEVWKAKRRIVFSNI